MEDVVTMMGITDKLRDWVDDNIDDEDMYNDCLDIVDEIDEHYLKAFDNANLPLDMHGMPCNLDDIVWYDGKKMLVVAISHKGSVNIRNFGTKDAAFWVKASLVMHEPDTQEKIYKDTEKLSVDYARMQLHDAYCIEIAIRKLLYRQQILDSKI